MSDAVSRRSVHDVDRHVGAVIRATRRANGVTQVQLADALGVTFQQIQKYEDGTNRLTSSKLLGIAQTLNAPLSSFFDGLAGFQDGHPENSKVSDFFDQPGAQDLMCAFVGMTPQLKAVWVALAKSLADDDDPEIAASGDLDP